MSEINQCLTCTNDGCSFPTWQTSPQLFNPSQLVASETLALTNDSEATLEVQLQPQFSNLSPELAAVIHLQVASLAEDENSALLQRQPLSQILSQPLSLVLQPNSQWQLLLTWTHDKINYLLGQQIRSTSSQYQWQFALQAHFPEVIIDTGNQEPADTPATTSSQQSEATESGELNEQEATTSGTLEDGEATASGTLDGNGHHKPSEQGSETPTATASGQPDYDESAQTSENGSSDNAPAQTDKQTHSSNTSQQNHTLTQQTNDNHTSASTDSQQPSTQTSVIQTTFISGGAQNLSLATNKQSTTTTRTTTHSFTNNSSSAFTPSPTPAIGIATDAHLSPQVLGASSVVQPQSPSVGKIAGVISGGLLILFLVALLLHWWFFVWRQEEESDNEDLE
ncbi:hypothetical protein IJJ27_01590 [bacterium]|nr:hypothetical protein [bacterium]